MDTFNDAIVIPDKYNTYLKSLRPGEKPEVMVIAKESLALQSINFLVDNKDEIGSIIDPGSQIVAMSEEVCHKLSLVYDLEVRLHMQSANKSIDQSLGLSRNVPC